MTHVLAAGTNTDVIARETLFWILAVASVGAALAMILVRRAVHCAMMLAVVMLCLATMYAMQGAPFLAFVQIIVYTGAVLMLFLFVIMLIGISSADSIVETIKGQRLAAGFAAIGLLVILILGIGHAAIGPATPPTAANGADNVSGLAALIFTTYVFPFEVTGALLITAALGAMVLAHRERTAPKPTQRDLAARRLASGQLAPDPSPGVYALHDAADRPALLPDGSTSDLSVSPTLSQREVSEAPQSVRPRRDGGDYGGKRRAGARPFDTGTPVGEGRLVSPVHYVALSVILFVIGGVGVLVRRNAIVMFMCIELMLNACNLAFVAFASMHGNLDGQVIAFFVMVVAAAEVVVGLAILMAIYRARRSASVDDANLLKY